MSEKQTATREHYDHGRLWPDGTFNKLGWSDEKMARREFGEKEYELENVPESLRPVLARQRVVTTTETYTAEAIPEATK
jgi:hypothetical protein